MAMLPHKLDVVFADIKANRDQLNKMYDAAIEAAIAAEENGGEGVGPGPGQAGANAFAESLGLGVKGRHFEG